MSKLKRSGIYKLTNPANGIIYIGQSKDVDSRVRGHMRDLKSGTHRNKRMQADFNESGIPFEWELLAEGSNLNGLESEACHNYNVWDASIGYNAARLLDYRTATPCEVITIREDFINSIVEENHVGAIEKGRLIFSIKDASEELGVSPEALTVTLRETQVSALEKFGCGFRLFERGEESVFTLYKH